MKTGSFKALVRWHVAEDPAFADALRCESIEVMLSGDIETGETILRDYIKATVDVARLSPSKI